MIHNVKKSSHPFYVFCIFRQVFSETARACKSRFSNENREMQRIYLILINTSSNHFRFFIVLQDFTSTVLSSLSRKNPFFKQKIYIPNQKCPLIARPSSRTLICPRTCKPTPPKSPPKPWRSSTSRRTSPPTSRRSSTRSTTPPGTASSAATSALTSPTRPSTSSTSTSVKSPSSSSSLVRFSFKKKLRKKKGKEIFFVNLFI